MSDSAARRPDAAPARAARLYVDAEGMQWHVSEQEFSEYDRRRGRSLIFSSDTAVRRVRDYPVDWRTLSDEALAALSWKA